MSYFELKCHSCFSFLEGASQGAELGAQARFLGLKGIAITDRNGVYALPKTYQALQGQNVKLISGADLKVRTPSGAFDFFVTLLAQTKAGYGLLSYMITRAHSEKEKGTAFLTWEEFCTLTSDPRAKDLFCITPHFYHPEEASAPQMEAFAPVLIRELKTKFELKLSIPLTFWLDGRDEARKEALLTLSRRWETPLVATNEVRYHAPSRQGLHDVLTATRYQTTVQEAGWRLSHNAERYLKSPTQMKALYRSTPEALEQTLAIGEACTFSLKELRYQYPSEWIPAHHTAQSYLSELIQQSLPFRYPQGAPENVLKQLAHELKLIEELKFADYFLTIWDIVRFAQEKKILYQGRGSAANSIVCYVLRITAIDPVHMNLLFERFISADRGEPPDIDVDFEHERREEVIQYLYEKYGRHRAGMVSTVISYRPRSALRDVTKALGLSTGVWNRLEARRLMEKVHHEPQYENVRSLMCDIADQPRHLGIHTGGFTLSAGRLDEIVPIEPARMKDRTIIQWDKYDLDIVGLLKVDVLALGMLTTLRKNLDLLGKDLNLAQIPPDDPATYKMIQKADTIGVFQIESRAQMNMLGRLLPQNFYDLVIQVAIVRPGPIVGKMVHPYLKRRKGLESPESPHPALKTILDKTLGVPLFQEQIMKMAIALAQFTPGEADELRRAIGAWRSSGAIEKMGQKLMKGLLASGLSPDYVESIFNQIKGFAEYGFPESHAASFALLAYCSAYLKCHSPAEFACALVNSQPMGFYSVHTILEDLKRHGISVLPMDLQISDWDCKIEADSAGKKGLRLGFRLTRGLSEKDFDLLKATRAKKPFQSVHDFMARVPLKASILERLTLAGVFAPFEQNPREALWDILKLQLLLHGQRSNPQLSLFSQSFASTAQDSSHFADLSPMEKISSDYAAYGISLHGHPMTLLRARLPKGTQKTHLETRALPHNSEVQIAGLIIVRQKPSTAKGTVFATMEDESGTLDLILHKSTYDKYKWIFSEHSFVRVKGHLQKDGFSVSVLVKSVSSIFETHLDGPTASILSHDWH